MRIKLRLQGLLIFLSIWPMGQPMCLERHRGTESATRLDRDISEPSGNPEIRLFRHTLFTLNKSNRKLQR